MITHDQIWGALDTIAKNNSISPSRMAINSGLDATTFNNYYSACTRFISILFLGFRLAHVPMQF